MDRSKRKGLFPWQVGECVGTFWRPGFDFNLYPYCPAHITKPKEIKKLYIVPLPEKCFFAVRTPRRPSYTRSLTFSQIVYLACPVDFSCKERLYAQLCCLSIRVASLSHLL